MKTVNIMKNYKVSKEFIIEAYAAACDEWKQKIEVQFPELFKPGVEPGKWCKFDNTYLVYIQELYENGEAKVYGFHNGEWYTSNEFQAIGGILMPKEATDIEVELALTEEAYRRGYKEGVVINSIQFPGDTYTMNHCKPSLCSGNRLRMGGGLILKDGKWAEVTKEKTYKVGDKINIECSGIYKICRIGIKTISLIDHSGESWNYTAQFALNEYKITKKELNDHIGDYKWKLA